MAQLTTNPRGPLTLTGSLLTQAEPSEALPLTAVTGQPTAASATVPAVAIPAATPFRRDSSMTSDRVLLMPTR